MNTRHVVPNVQGIDFSQIPIEGHAAMTRVQEVKEPCFPPGSLEKAAECEKEMEHLEKAGRLVFQAISAGAFQSRTELAQILVATKEPTVNFYVPERARGLFLSVATVLLKGEAAYGPGKSIHPPKHPGDKPEIIEHKRMLIIPRLTSAWDVSSLPMQ